jgi:MarR family transcriptional regulator for hemolysin
LSDVARLLHTVADQKADASGLPEPNAPFLRGSIAFECLKQSELAEMLDVQPITLTRLLNGLCREWADRETARLNDRRAKRLFLTAAARPVLSRLDPLGDELLSDALAGVDPRRVSQLLEDLGAVNANLRRAIHKHIETA